MDSDERNNELSNLIDEFLNEVREKEEQKGGAMAIIKSVKGYLFSGKNINTVSDAFTVLAQNIKEFITDHPYDEEDDEATDEETYNDMADEALEEYGHGQDGGAYKRKSRRRRASRHRKSSHRRKASRKVSRRRITRRKMRRAH